MNRLQRTKQLLGLLFLGCCLLFAVPVHATGAAQGAQKDSNISTKVTKKNSDVKLTTACGIDGFAVYDKPVVITVTVQSSRDFTGSIRVIPAMEQGDRVVATAEEISLAGGEAKTFRFTVKEWSGNGKFDVQLLDEKEKVVYAETDRATLSNLGTNVVLGILSDDYSALNYFDGVPVVFSSYQGLVTTLELTADSFPESREALSILNYIVIDNYDTAKLSAQQYQALQEWVKGGGVLILSLGPNYQNVLHLFTDDFVSGTLGTLTKKDLEWNGLNGLFSMMEGAIQPDGSEDLPGNNPDDDQNQEPADELMNESAEKQEEEPDVEPDGRVEETAFDVLAVNHVDCIDFELADGQEMEGFSTQNSAYKKECGAGTVVVLSYALGMEPIAGSSNRKDIATFLLAAASGDQTEDVLNGSYVYYANNLSSGASLAEMLNDTRTPSVLLFGTVLAAYVILVGPVLYLILKKKGNREKIWVSIPIVALAFTGVIYMLGTFYRVRKPMVNTFTVFKVDNDTKRENVYANIICPKAKQYSIMLNKSYTDIGYDPYYYNYSLFGNASENDEFDYMFCKKNGGLELTMNNNTAFSETYFTATRVLENDIGSVDLDLHCYTDGFEGTATNNTNYDLEDVVITFENHYYQAGDIRKGETVSVDKEKIIYAYSYGTFNRLYSDQGSLYSDRQLHIQYEVDTFMENNYAHDVANGQGLVWGRIRSYVPELTKDSSVKTAGQAVYLTDYTAAYEDITGSYCPDIAELQVSSTDDYDGADGQMYANTIDVTYSFEEYPDITQLVNCTYGQTPPNYGSAQYAKVYAYDAENGVYVEIFKDSDTLSGAEFRRFLHDNTLILRFSADATDYYSTYIPRIAAKGE